MNFQYKAKAANGKIMRGSQAADNEAELISWIRDKGWVPIDVSRSFEAAAQLGDAVAGKSVDWGEFFTLSPKIKLKDKAIFFRQMATMISAGVPITGAIEILQEQTTNKRLARVIKQLYVRVSSGVPLGVAIAEHPKCFDTLTSALVRSGEESGTLDSSLSKLAGFLESQDALKKKIVSAMTYPIAVMSIALIVLGLMLTIVVPQFEKAFSQMNVKMPWLTEMTFKAGNLAKVYWYVPPLAIFAVFFAFFLMKRFKIAEYGIDSFLLKLPIFGDIIYKAAISRSFRTMSSLLRSGVQVLQTIEMAGDVAGNAKIKRAFLMMRDSAAMGSTMNAVMRERKLFPPMITHMVAVGEETGRTDEMLERVADWYESELNEKIKRLSSILEPILICFVGLIVGFMVLAIFLPIISAIQAFL